MFSQVDDGLMDVGLLAHVSRTRILSLFDQVKKSYVAPRTGPRSVDPVAPTLVAVIHVCVCVCVYACLRGWVGDMFVIYIQRSNASQVHISCASCMYVCLCVYEAYDVGE